MTVNKNALPADRRRRVQILKRIIIGSLFAAILLPVILCVILFCRMHALEEQLADIREIVAAAAQTDTVESRLEENGSSQGFIMEPGGAGSTGYLEAGGYEDNKGADEPAAEMRKVYLTFDDGPSSNTDAILDILAEYDVKATFFVVGRDGDWAEEAYRRIVEEGHTLAMHSYSHRYEAIYASVDAYAQDLNKLQEYLYEVTGVWCRYVRFPGGSSNKVSRVDMAELIAYLQEQGLTYFDWNVSSQDASGSPPSAEAMVDICLRGIAGESNVVVLFHDASGKQSTVQALPGLIEAVLKMENTELLPITDDTVPVQHITITQEEMED